MVNQVRTLDFLPEIFRTETNEQFLSATLDVLTQQPNLSKVQGFIGNKYGYGIGATDKYVDEPTSTRKNYQLDPAVTFLKTDTSIAQDFIDYPGIIDALTNAGGVTNDHNKLFKSKFYSWDSFTDLDKIVNYAQYYWLPLGPDAIQIDATVDLSDIEGKKSYTVTSGTKVGLEFINGLKVKFTGIVTPSDKTSVEYYVEGVGTSITLIPVDELICTEITAGGIYMPWDNDPWSTTDWSIRLYVPIQPDYTVVSRNSRDRNAWSRGNRWFSQSVVDLVTKYNGKVTVNKYNTQTRAQRPIIEIQGNLSLFNSGLTSAGVIDFLDTYTTDAFSTIVGQSFDSDNVKATRKLTVALGSNDDGTINVESTADLELGSAVEFRTDVTGKATQIDITNKITVESTVGLYEKKKIIFTGTTATIQLSAAAIGGLYLGKKVTFTDTFNGAVIVGKEYYVKSIDYTTNNVTVKDTLGNIDSNVTYFIKTVDSKNNQITISETPDGNEFALMNGPIRGSLTMTGTMSYVSTSSFGNIIPSDSTTSKLYFIKTIDAVNSTITLEDFVPSKDVGVMTITTSVSLTEGARVVFANDNDVNVRKNVYEVKVVEAGTNKQKVVSLTPVAGITVNEDSQCYVSVGPGNYIGTAWRFTTDKLGVTRTAGEMGWVQSQKKIAINQSPLFDIFNKNGISFSDTDFYKNSTFTGCSLLSYEIGTGTNDSVLGFPVVYSSAANTGDYKFNVNLNSDVFTYTNATTNENSTIPTSDGYVHYHPTSDTTTRKIGWVEAAAESNQYQVFIIDITSLNLDGVVCDIVASPESETIWAPVQVFKNGSFVDSSKYTVSTDNVKNTTTVSFTTTPTVGDQVSVMLISDQVSSTGYYQIPKNLQSNPFNAQINSVTAGDLKNYYASIFGNAPGAKGDVFGVNNLSNLGDLTKYGTTIIQNSASLVLPGVFLRKSEYNLATALQYNSDEYMNYKSSIIELANNGNYSVYQTPNQILDDIIHQISSVKNDGESFYWSDMLPGGSPYKVNTYNFNTTVSNTVVPLMKVYDFTNANYSGVLVYLSETVDNRTTLVQLIRGIDYTVSSTEPSLIINKTLVAGNSITVKEYNQTYGCYVPNTPTKLGLFPSTPPSVVLDSTFTTPTYFIVGHDGSYNKLYGSFDGDRLSDFRDIALFEFECRVYNNLKVSGEIPLTQTDVFPGQWRTTEYQWEDILPTYTTSFLNWVGKNRLSEYRRQIYNRAVPFTWNFNKSTNKISSTKTNPVLLKQGYWRGIYNWFYDTTNPASAPWEMLGLTSKPTWWEDRYGSAPYTSGNTLMWQEIADGYVWNNNSPYVDKKRIRSDLLNALPVDSNGKLVDPMINIVDNYDSNTFEREWVTGDQGPTESSYLKSSSWPFDLMRILSVFEPVKFYNLMADRDLYKYDAEFSQYLFNERYHLMPDQLTVYGSGTAKHSYINWIVDYISRDGTNGQSSISTTLKNLDVRLSYRLAGFSDKEYLQFLTENSSPSSATTSLLIPDDSTSLLLYDNVPSDKVVYSSVIIQKTTNGYTVWGNSVNNPYFKTVAATPGPNDKLTIGATTINLSSTFNPQSSVSVAYGTEFYSIQGVCEFLRNYGRYLTVRGVVFENISDTTQTVVDWTTMIQECVSWSQQSWEVGSTINLNPAATNFKVYRSGLIVQPLTLQRENFVLNQNLSPIQPHDMAVVRTNEQFNVKVLSTGDTVAFTNLNLSSIEHAIIFDNETIFGDVIYNTTSGLRQSRLIMKGKKTAEWNGSINATGFILNEGDIEEWNNRQKYPKGQIVTYKNLYWSAKNRIEPSENFDYTQWTESSYDSIKRGLLPNPSTIAYESSMLYDIQEANLEQDSDLLAFGLIGFRPRDYMAKASLTDVTQINVYNNMIRAKGTNAAADAFIGATPLQGALDYSVRENWALKVGDFGSVLNNNFVEVQLQQNLLTGNPSLIGFGDASADSSAISDLVSMPSGVHQKVAIGTLAYKDSTKYPNYKYENELINYGRLPADANFLPEYSLSYVEERGLPTAGYVNINDVKFLAYNLTDLNLNTSSIGDLYRGDIVWVANYKGTWDIFTAVSLGTVLTKVTNNLNGTVTMTFDTPHGLSTDSPFYITDFDSKIDGYYEVTTVNNLNSVTVTSSLATTVPKITGTGIAMKLVSRRLSQASDLASIDSLVKYSEFNSRLSWVDENTDSEWSVWATSPEYSMSEVTVGNSVSQYGKAVAYSGDIGQLAVDSTGKLYRNGFVVNSVLADTKITKQLTATNFTLSDIKLYGSVGSTLLSFVVDTDVVGVIVGQLLSGTGITDGTTVLSIDSKSKTKTITISLPLTVDIKSTDNEKYHFSNPGHEGTYLLDTTQHAGSSTSPVDFYVGTENTKTFSGYIVETVLTVSSLSTSDPLLFKDTSGKSITLSLTGNTSVPAGTGKVTLIASGSKAYCSDPVGKNIYEYDFSGTSTTGIYSTVNSTSIDTTGALAVSQDGLWLYTVINSGGTGKIRTYHQGTYHDSDFTISLASTLATSSDGEKLIVGEPDIDSNGLSEAGRVTTYARASHSFLQTNADPVGENKQFPYTTDTDGFTPRIPADNLVATVYINGNKQNDRTYTIDSQGRFITFNAAPADGSVIVVDYAVLLPQQTLLSSNIHIGSEYGKSVTTSRYGAEVFVGAPYELSTVNDTKNVEGAVYRWTNLGQRYGTVIGRVSNMTLGDSTILGTLFIDGYKVPYDASKITPTPWPPGYTDTNKNRVAYQINLIQPTNVVAAYDNTEKLILTNAIGTATFSNNQIDIVGLTPASLTNIGLYPYGSYNSKTGYIEQLPTQIIHDINLDDNSQFGWSVVANQESSLRDSIAIGAPSVNSISETTFDSPTNDNVDNDTIFDSGATTFVYEFPFTGSVYQYDYLPSQQESIESVGMYAFGQYCNVPSDSHSSASPRFGEQIAFNDGVIIVGSPTWYNSNTGRVVTYKSSDHTSSWYTYKKPLARVSVNSLSSISVYDTEANKTLDTLDYIDPVQGKMLSAVETNIDYISATDPAVYVNGQVWDSTYVGTTWLDVSNLRMMNYSQPDIEYNSSYWGQAFPGSTADIYTWIQSDVTPLTYVGQGYVVDFNNYTSATVIDKASNVLKTNYFFWVKNYSGIPKGKTLSPVTVGQYILNPISSGVSFLAAITTNVVGLFNVQDSIQSHSSALHLGYGVGNNNDSGHQNWTLIQDGNEEDFLNGVPGDISDTPGGMYLKYLNSFMGVELTGQSVPDTTLPELVRYGTSFRPRQSMFVNRVEALTNFIEYANNVMSQYTIAETRGTYLLSMSGIFNGTNYDTTNFWSYTDWWETGYSASTKVTLEVSTYSQLLTIGQTETINVGSDGIIVGLSDGLVARVLKNGQGLNEYYRYTSTAGWTRIGLQNGTIKILSSLCTNITPLPSMEIYYIVRWVTEQLYVNELLIENNQSLMMMFNLIQSQALQQQNYLPWLNKTSLIDVKHTIRQLLPYSKYQRDTRELVDGYLREVKPYHVYIKDFSFQYKGIDYYEGSFTDFDLPAMYNTSSLGYISPQLVYSNVDLSSGQYISTSNVWSQSSYSDWFSNYGLSLSTAQLSSIELTTLATDSSTVDLTITVSDSSGLPVNGTIQIGDETISYNTLDRFSNTIGDLTRSVNLAPAKNYSAGDKVYLIPTPVMIMNSGRGYLTAPTVTAYIDLTAYPTGPRTAASFSTTLSATGELTNVEILNSGSGYPTMPEIIVDSSSISVSFTSGQIDMGLSQLTIKNHPFCTTTSDSGIVIPDCVVVTGAKLLTGESSDTEYYYVRSVDSDTIALYRNFKDASGESTPTTSVSFITTNEFTILTIESTVVSESIMTGDRVKVVYNDSTYAPTYGYIQRVSINELTNDLSFALFSTYEQAIVGSISDRMTLSSNAGKLLKACDKRVVFKDTTNGKIAVTALLNSYTNNLPIRQMKINMKFDRVTYSTNVSSFNADSIGYSEYGYDSEISGFSGWSSGKEYTKGQLVHYNDQLYRCTMDTTSRSSTITLMLQKNGVTYYKQSYIAAQIDQKATIEDSDIEFTISGTDGGGWISLVDDLGNNVFEDLTGQTITLMGCDNVDSFDLSYWIEVGINDTSLTAAERIAGFYKPTSSMPGFTYNDVSQLMTGTKYPYQIVQDPEFNYDQTYAFVSSQVDIANNTIQLRKTKSQVAIYQEVIRSVVNNVISVTSTPAVTETAILVNDSNDITHTNILTLNSFDNVANGVSFQFYGEMICDTINLGTTYYIVNANASSSTIQISTTSDGANIVPMKNASGMTTMVLNSYTHSTNTKFATGDLVKATYDAPIKRTTDYYYARKVSDTSLTLHLSKEDAFANINQVFVDPTTLGRITQPQNIVALVGSTGYTAGEIFSAMFDVSSDASGFGLTKGNEYWLRIIDGLSAGVYNHKTDAEDDVNRIPLLQQIGGQFITGHYDSVVGGLREQTTDTQYNIVGSPFDFGYAPEELVAGVISDGVNFTVTTKPGATWDAYATVGGVSPNTNFGYSGFGMIRLASQLPGTVTLPNGTTVAPVVGSIKGAISFKDVMLNPVSISVYTTYNSSLITDNGGTHLRYSIDYTVDWINKVVTIIDTSDTKVCSKFDVVVYDFGNGNQMVRSNNSLHPLRTVISTSTVANGLVVGKSYTIASHGTTDFIEIGAIPSVSIIGEIGTTTQLVDGILTTYITLDIGTDIVSGTVDIGTYITGSGIPAGTYVDEQLSSTETNGALGLKGTYSLKVLDSQITNITVGPQAIFGQPKVGTGFVATVPATWPAATPLPPFVGSGTGTVTSTHSEIYLNVPYAEIEIPSEKNFWLSSMVYHGSTSTDTEKLTYLTNTTDINYASTGHYSIEPQRDTDLVSDPYNPAKIVFTELYDNSSDYVSFVLTSTTVGMFNVNYIDDKSTKNIHERQSLQLSYSVPFTDYNSVRNYSDFSTMFNNVIVPKLKIYVNSKILSSSSLINGTNYTNYTLSYNSALNTYSDFVIRVGRGLEFINITFAAGVLAENDIIRVSYNEGYQTSSPLGVVTVVEHSGTGVSLPVTQYLSNSRHIKVKEVIKGVILNSAITDSSGNFSCDKTFWTMSVGDAVSVIGTLSGSGSIAGYASGNQYYIIATNGSTSYQLSATSGGSAITTTSGTTTGLKFRSSVVTDIDREQYDLTEFLGDDNYSSFMDINVPVGTLNSITGIGQINSTSTIGIKTGDRVTVTGSTTISNTLSGGTTNIMITSTDGVFTCNEQPSTELKVGDEIQVSGTLIGTGSITGYTTPKTYYITATNGSTSFKLVDQNAASLVTTVGTTEGLTFSRSSGGILGAMNVKTSECVADLSGTTLTYVSGATPVVGSIIMGTGIPDGTTIVSGTSPTFTMSAPVTTGSSIQVFSINYNNSAIATVYQSPTVYYVSEYTGEYTSRLLTDSSGNLLVPNVRVFEQVKYTPNAEAFYLTSYLGGPPDVKVTSGSIKGLTFSVANNLNLEINGVRYDGPAPTQIVHKLRTIVTEDTLSLSYPAPVYSIASFDQEYLIVEINGVNVPQVNPSDNTEVYWNVDYDFTNGQFSQFDADFTNVKLQTASNPSTDIYGFFDDGTPFDNQFSFNIVFNPNFVAYDLNANPTAPFKLTTGTAITVSYEVPGDSPPDVYTINVNESKTGGTINILSSLIPSGANNVRVTSYGRTTQQSIATQSISDATINQIPSPYGVTSDGVNAPVVTTVNDHSLIDLDQVYINGTAVKNLDGKIFYVRRMGPKTVELYTDSQLNGGSNNFVTDLAVVSTSPAGCVLPSPAHSYIQLIKREQIDVSIPNSALVVAQPAGFELTNIDRLYVGYMNTDSSIVYHIPPEKLSLLNYNGESTLLISKEIVPGDKILLTSMVPQASPTEQTMRINNTWNTVSGKPNVPTIYRENPLSRTYVSKVNYTTSGEIDSIKVFDPTKLVVLTTFNNINVTLKGGVYSALVSVQDSNQITNVNVLGVSNFIWAGESNSTTIKITFDSYPGATVNVNIYTGNNAIINGEQLQYKRINLDFNSVSYGLLSGLTRARNTTLSANIKLYDEVRSILTKNELPTGFLDKSWYSNIIETTIEDSVKYSTGSAKVIANASSGVQGDSSVSIVNSTRSGSNVFTGADTGIFYFATNTVPNIINVSAGDVISFKNGAKPIYTSLSNIAPVSPVSASGIFNFTIADHPQIQDVKVGAPLTVSNNSSILSYKKIVGTSTTTMTEFPVTYSHKNIANSAQWTIKIAEPIEIVGTNITANVGVYDNFKVISSARRTVYDSHDESNASEFVPQWEVKISNIGYNKDSNSYSQSANAQPISANSYPEVTANCKVTLSHTIMDLPLSLDGNMDSTNFSLAASFFSSTKS